MYVVEIQTNRITIYSYLNRPIKKSSLIYFYKEYIYLLSFDNE